MRNLNLPAGARAQDSATRFGRKTFKMAPVAPAEFFEEEEGIQTYIKALSGSLIQMVPRNSDDLIHVVTTLRFLKYLEETVDLLFGYSLATES